MVYKLVNKFVEEFESGEGEGGEGWEASQGEGELGWKGKKNEKMTIAKKISGRA